MEKKDNLLVFSVGAVLAIAIFASLPSKRPALSQKQVFTDIYANEAWNGGSGEGSKRENVIPYMEYLQKFLDTQEDIRSVIDIGCGDWELMKHIKIPDHMNYLGVDLVENVISVNKSKYEKDNVKFEIVNKLTDLTKYGGDLLILKDVAQHWDNASVAFAINKIIPNFKYAILVNDIRVQNVKPLNSDIQTGDFRPIDLAESPFFMRLRFVKDFTCLGTAAGRTKRIYLYVRKDYCPCLD